MLYLGGVVLRVGDDVNSWTVTAVIRLKGITILNALILKLRDPYISAYGEL